LGEAATATGELLIWNGHSIARIQVVQAQPEAEITDATTRRSKQPQFDSVEEQAEIAVGFVTTPRQLRLSMLVLEPASSANTNTAGVVEGGDGVSPALHVQVGECASAPRVVVQRSVDPFFAPYCMTMSELSNQVNQMFDLERGRACIHFLREQCDSTGDAARASVGAAATTSTAPGFKTTVASILFDRGDVLDRVFYSGGSGHPHSNRKRQSGSGGATEADEEVISIHGSSFIGELPSVGSLLVEDRAARGLRQDSVALAERHVSRIASEWQLTLEIDCKLDRIFSEVLTDGGRKEEGLADREKFVVPELITISVFKSATVAEMKAAVMSKLLSYYDSMSRPASGGTQQALRKFEEAACQRVQLRAGLERGVRVLGDETLSIQTAVSTGGATLFLEETDSRKLAPGCIDITVALVVNNSWKFDYERSIAIHNSSSRQANNVPVLERKLGGLSVQQTTTADGEGVVVVSPADATGKSSEGAGAGANVSSNLSAMIAARGERLQEVQLTVSATESITSIRDRAGVMLLGLESGWTAGAAASSEETPEVAAATALPGPDTAGSDDAAAVTAAVTAAASDAASDADAPDAEESPTVSEVVPRRLRTTTWLKEPAALLLEDVKMGSGNSAAESAPVGKAKQAATAGIPVDPGVATAQSAGLRGGDTLLLEEGPLPVKGQVTFEVSTRVDVLQ
jgi:hypothetical protein